MGADVNYCNYDSHFGTPLQRAAQRGLLQTASLLLSHGANPLIAGFMRRNALDSARDENHAEIVRIIEDKICFFSGLLRKLDDTVIQDMEKIWVVVLPGDSSLSTDVTRLKMATYRNRHSAKPSKILSLRHYTFKRPDFNQQDPEFVLVDESSGALYSYFAFLSPFIHLILRQELAFKYVGHRMRLRSGETGDKEQLMLLYNACSGRIRARRVCDVASISQEDSEIVGATAASIQISINNGIPLSADQVDGQWKRNDFNDLSATAKKRMDGASTSSLSSSSSCVICAGKCGDTACVPCGHLASCMSCLTEIMKKDMGCPVCHAPIEFFLKIYPI
ncbi:putative E3 ubiquitin-protein ligase XBAT34 isoform X3 [Wolffia australiana]